MGLETYYGGNLARLIERVNAGLGLAETPWVISALNSHQAFTVPGWSTVCGAQNELPAANHLVYTVATEDLELNVADAIHYSSASLLKLGERLACALLSPRSATIAGGVMMNLSVRTFCGTGDAVLILGTVVAPNGDLPLVVRGWANR